MTTKQQTARDEINKSRRALMQANLLKFPAVEPAFYSKFSFVQYSRNNPKERTVAIGTSAEIILPLPFNLKEQYSMNYSGTDLKTGYRNDEPCIVT